MIAAAQTGTGKTAAFSLPSMDKLGHAKGGAAANRPSYEKKTWQSAAQGRKDAPAKEALYAKNPPGLISGN